MKIFAFTDTHGDKKVINNLIKKIKEKSPDIIVCAGDLTNFGTGLKSLILKFKTLKSPFLIIPGNHETNKELQTACKKNKEVLNLHQKSYEINNYIFFGYGLGGFDTIDKKLEKIIPLFKKTINKNSRVILITHQPPYKTKLDKLPSGHAGSKSIRKFITEINPILHICGHLHENENKKDKIKNTIIINPGDKGKLIKI